MALLRSTLLLLAFCCLSLSGSAQPARSYAFSAITGTYTALSSGTAVTSIQADDVATSGIPIGFTFRFCGSNYTTVSVSSNGFVSFTGTTSSTAGNTIGNLATIAPGLMPLWDDLNGNAGTARYVLTGTAPNRVWTMEWSGWKWYYTSSANVISFQVRLYEGTNVIQFHYSQGATAPSGSRSATIGIAGSANDYQFLATSGSAPATSTSALVDTITVRPATDQIYQWTPPAACSGPISAGTAYTPSLAVCPNLPFTLSDTGMTIASSINYAWQSSPAGANTWTTVPGAISWNTTGSASIATLTVAAGVSAPTDFRFVDTCTVSSTTATSNVLALTLQSYLLCACASTATSPADDDIGQFTVGSWFANPAAAPSPLTSNTAANKQYTDFTTVPPIDLVAGQSTPFTVSQFNLGSTWYQCGLAIYCDFTHNASFTDPGETVYGPTYGSTTPVSPSHTGNIVIPATALTGLARLRLILRESSTTISPCLSYSWGETEDYIVNILPATPPAPTVSTNSPVCQKNTITITASIPAPYRNPTYTLTGPAIGTLTSTTGVFTIPNSVCANGGTYTVTARSNNQTSAATTFNVVVNCIPTIGVGNIVTPTTCLTTDGSFEVTGLTPAAVYTISYRKNGAAATTATITANSSGVANAIGLTSGNYTDIFVRTAAGCNSDTLATVTQVPAPNPPPTPVLIVSPSPICGGNTVTVAVSSPIANGTYNWNGPNGFTATGTSISLPNFSSALDGTYSVTVTVTGCLSAPGTATLTMTAPSARPVRNNITYCQYDVPVAMTAQTLSGYFVEWFDTCSGGPGCVNGLRSRNSTPTNPNPPTPNTNIPGIVMWLVRQSAPNGCPSAFDSVYVRVLPRPLAPAVSASIAYCQYEVIGPLTASGSNLRWFATPTGGIGSATAPVPSTLIPGTYNFYVSQTSADGCESPRSQITVVVKPKPQPPAVTSPLNLCQGDDPRELSAIGRDLLWYTGPSGGVGVGVAPVISTSYEDSFFYYVTQTVNGCESDRALIASYVRYKPNGVITASAQSVCQDGYDTFYYYGNGRPDAEYHWFAPLSSQIISGDSTAGPVVIYFDTAGTSTVQLIVNNKGCISKLLAAPINVRPLPVISFVNRQDACEDELINVALRTIESEITGYQWDFGPEATVVYGEVRTGGPFGIRYPRAGQYAISATATKKGCTSQPIVQDIFIHPRPDATISYDYKNGRPIDQFCSMDTLHLTVQAVPEGATYKWTPGAFFQSKEDSLNNEVRAVINFSTNVNVTVTSAFGCESKDSLFVPVKPCCNVYFPNAFSPGSKIEVNSRFRPVTNGIHRVNNFRIMNRWGQVIWESTEPGASWDGTFRGVPQDMGTYYFYVNYRCGDKNVEDQGEVILIR